MPNPLALECHLQRLPAAELALHQEPCVYSLALECQLQRLPAAELALRHEPCVYSLALELALQRLPAAELALRQEQGGERVSGNAKQPPQAGGCLFFRASPLCLDSGQC